MRKFHSLGFIALAWFIAATAHAQVRVVAAPVVIRLDLEIDEQGRLKTAEAIDKIEKAFPSLLQSEWASLTIEFRLDEKSRGNANRERIMEAIKKKFPPNEVHVKVLFQGEDMKPAAVKSLEELQAEAVKNHPDVKVAEAKLRLAEAELEQTRMLIKAKMAAAHAEYQAAVASEAEGKIRLQRAEKAFLVKAISAEELGAAMLTWTKLHSERIVAEARLQAFTGRPAVKKDAPK